MQPSAPTRSLVAYDGSPAARRALRSTVGRLHAGDRIGVIHVGEPASAAGVALDAACLALAARGIAVVPIHALGDPARTICVTAERDRYDTIVVGRRGDADRGRLLLGPVSARIVEGATCDVIVIA